MASTAIVQAYVGLIRAGQKTLDDVPAVVREAVKEALEAREDA